MFLYISVCKFSVFNLVHFFLWPCHAACGTLVPWPGIEPTPPVVKVQNLNHWTFRQVPKLVPFFFFFNRNLFKEAWVSELWQMHGNEECFNLRATPQFPGWLVLLKQELRRKNADRQKEKMWPWVCNKGYRDAAGIMSRRLWGVRALLALCLADASTHCFWSVS